MDDRADNARQIENEIGDLESEFGSSLLDLFDISSDQSDYDSFWARVRELNSMFKEMRLDNEPREELWGRLSKLCEDVKGAHASQKEQRRIALDSNRDTIWQAIHNLGIAHNLSGVSGWLYETDLKGFWADAKEISDLFRDTKPLRGRDREELWEDFQSLCQQAHDLQDQKHEEWRARNEEHVERWRSNIEKGEETIERLKGQIEHCEDLRSDAKTDDFADEVQGWIDEKQRIIDDIEARNSEAWAKIADVEQRLRS